MQFEKRKLADLKPAEYNPRETLTPDDPKYQEIKQSILDLGYSDPIVINSDGTIIKGHQRRNVMMDIGFVEAEVVVLDIKDKAKEKALNIALNKITGRWDVEKLKEVIGQIDLSGIDATVTGFKDEEIKRLIGDVDLSWFERENRNDTTRQEGNKEYNDFLEKFEPKKTTDDCYTPDGVYEAVANWVAEEYKVSRAVMVRPFYPGGDYQQEGQYDEDSVVVDNPPFSILAEILKWYTEHRIRFFLFAPALTLFSSLQEVCAIGVGVTITYENGATVGTSFLTNLEYTRIRSAPTLYAAVKAADEANRAEKRKDLPKYSYPDAVITSTKLSYFSKYGIEFRQPREATAFIRGLDAMKEAGKEIYGGGFLLSDQATKEKVDADKAAQEKAAQEKVDALQWELSQREKGMVKVLNGGGIQWMLSARELEIVKQLGTKKDERTTKKRT